MPTISLRCVASIEVAVEIDLHSRYERDLDYEGIPRQKPPTRPISRRIGIAEVEECFGEREARLEGKRAHEVYSERIWQPLGMADDADLDIPSRIFSSKLFCLTLHAP